MKKLIITESQYKLLHEIDFEDTFSDVVFLLIKLLMN